jgi:DNA (cytosine-5)-methyltransferase 1
MRYFSSFTGAGGFDLAMPKDWECVGFSEIDKHASMVLKYRFPDVKNYGDINAINWNEIPNFDLLCGGTPCQDLSLAGKRKGLAGKRSGLFYKFVEALKAKKPEYFVWENVKGAISSNQGWDFAEVLNTLSEAGYNLWWQVLNAKYFGVPQNRERIFIVGFRDRRPPEVFFEPTGSTTDNELQGQPTANTLRARYNQNLSKGSYIIEDQQQAQEVISALTATYYKGDSAKHYAERGNRTLLLNNNLLKLPHYPQEAKPIELTKNKSMAERVYSLEGSAISLRGNGGGYGGKTGLYAVQAVLTPNRETKRQNGRRFKNPEEPMFTLTGQDIHGVGFTRFINGNIVPTLTATKDKGSAYTPLLVEQTKIRRLTPRECERLMSWPDDWLCWGIDENGSKVEISDTQRYKMAGNGVVSNVVKWLIENVILRD